MTEVCRRCGEEVRWGWRPGLRSPTWDGSGFWMHRDPETDHHILFGTELADIPTEDVHVEPDAEPIPPIEVHSTPIDIGDERLPAGAKSIINLARAQGWTATATYSRGPRTHGTTGELLGMSDFVVVRAVLDETGELAVGSWKDGSFDFGYAGEADPETRKIVVTRINSKGLRAHLTQEAP